MLRCPTILLSVLLAVTASATDIKRGDVATAVFGDAATLKAFMSAIDVTAQRLHLHHTHGIDEYSLSSYERDAAIPVSRASVEELHKLLSDPKSQSWNHIPDERGLRTEKTCAPDYGVLLTFRDANRAVRVALCFECNLFGVFIGDGVNPRRVNTEEDFDSIRPQLIDIVRSLFPRDEQIQKLTVRGVTPTDPRTPVKPTMPHSDLDNVLLFYSFLSGKALHVDAGVGGSVDIVADHSMPSAEAQVWLRNELLERYGIEIRDVSTEEAQVSWSRDREQAREATKKTLKIVPPARVVDIAKPPAIKPN